MEELGLIPMLLMSSLLGTLLGFSAGLVPGLHMNNIAAAMTAYASGVIGTFEFLGGFLGNAAAGLLIASFLSSAVVAHMFAEAITSTYLGIPAGDVVSVLPAHRLAKAGLGRAAVRASADGSLAGIITSVIVLFPMCVLMGDPVGLYGHLREIMGIITLVFSVILVASDAIPSLHRRNLARETILNATFSAAVFLTAGLLGFIVLETQYFSCGLPDFPWRSPEMVPKASLLLPMFAGLFGVPSLILSLGSRNVADVSDEVLDHAVTPHLKEVILSIAGGALVGWLPGMTSGSSATICSPTVRESVGKEDIDGSLRFIWLYASISSAGAVFAVGALFVILRARSGSMDAAALFLGMGEDGQAWTSHLPYMFAIVLSMVISAMVSHAVIGLLRSRLNTLHSLLCSKRVALGSLLFVCMLSIALTGSRGALLLATAASLGILPPQIGVRRIQLMGCLLVPITVAALGP